MMRIVDKNKHAKKRTEIIQAAVKCFEEWGLIKTSTAKICAAAKISPGHLYHYFASKDEILAAIADQVFATAVDYFAHPDASLTTFDVLVQFFRDRIYQNVKGNRSVLMDLISQSNHDDRTRDILRKYTQRLQSLLAETIRTGQASGEISTTISADITALLMISLIDAGKVLPVRVSDENALEQTRQEFVSLIETRLTP